LCGFLVSHLTVDYRIAVDTIFPIFLKNLFGWSSGQTGLFFLAFYVPNILCILSGHLADKYGARWLCIAGLLGCVTPLLALQYISSNTYETKCLMIQMTIALGVGIALVNTPITAEVVFTVIEKEQRHPSLQENAGGYGIAYGFFMTAIALGATLGSFVSTWIIESYGWKPLMLTLATCCLLTAIPVGLWLGPKRDGGRWSCRKFLGRMKARFGEKKPKPSLEPRAGTIVEA
jgi:MFS family permease